MGPTGAMGLGIETLSSLDTGTPSPSITGTSIVLDGQQGSIIYYDNDYVTQTHSIQTKIEEGRKNEFVMSTQPMKSWRVVVSRYLR